jgi:hypothetical protein
MKTIEFDEKCKSCKGTGLFAGMAERDGFAVICSQCKGTGCYHFVYEYEDFSGRIDAQNVIQVVESNPGICIGLGKEGGYSYESFGGMSYPDWRNGRPFPPKSEMRRHTCPSWWYQSVNYKKKPDWNECSTTWGGLFSLCPHFIEKEKCWERFDKENKSEL